MGGHAEYTAAKAGITRQDADEFSLRSHTLAVAAIDAGKFNAEIVPVSIETRRSTNVVDTDESPRRDTSIESLSKLRPAFPNDAPEGIDELVVTAGNAPGLNDGAAMEDRNVETGIASLCLGGGNAVAISVEKY